ncbi:hypothetical protein ABZW47_30645 [Streptomyces sp. NPDC004549]|uniref:hypothetical protein n=1 Tax=Streptomyces sp. NPDC004549 TaxID=3154283 RepID=UPI0033B5F774
MTSDRRALTALHLFLVWATMAAAVPVLALVLFASGRSGGAGAMGLVLALGAPLVVCALLVAAIPARTVVPRCGSARQRLGWAVSVFALGTLGVAAGVNAYVDHVDLGSVGTRIALVGVTYGTVIGPTHAQRHRHAADFTRYREHAEL